MKAKWLWPFLIAFVVSLCVFSVMVLWAWYTPPRQTAPGGTTPKPAVEAEGTFWVVCTGATGRELCGLLRLTGDGDRVTVTALPRETEITADGALRRADEVFREQGVEPLRTALIGDGAFAVLSADGAEVLMRYLAYGVVIDRKTVTAVQVRHRWPEEYGTLTTAVLRQYMVAGRDAEKDFRALTEAGAVSVGIDGFRAAETQLVAWYGVPYVLRTADGYRVGPRGAERFVWREGES